MKLLLVARKSLLEIFREPTLLGLVLLMPLVFVGIAAFGYSAPFLITHPVWVIVQAEGDLGLIEALRAERYPDNRSVFDVTVVTDQDAAHIALEEREITALVEVGVGADGRPMVTVHGDALYGRFYRASVVLDEVVQRYADGLAVVPNDLLSLIARSQKESTLHSLCRVFSFGEHPDYIINFSKVNPLPILKFLYNSRN